MPVAVITSPDGTMNCFINIAYKAIVSVEKLKASDGVLSKALAKRLYPTAGCADTICDMSIGSLRHQYMRMIRPFFFVDLPDLITLVLDQLHDRFERIIEVRKVLLVNLE